MQHIHCTRVVKPEKVPWPDARSHHGSCVLASPLTGHKNTHILSTGGEGISAESLNDVWIGEYNKERTTWKQVCASFTIINQIVMVHNRLIYLSND